VTRLSIVTGTRGRAATLAARALPSVRAQTVEVEWVVVSDGDASVRDVLEGVRCVYEEITHEADGFGLCRARSRGLELASGDLVAYLDDDNALDPGYAAAVVALCERDRDVRYGMASQRRRRDVVADGAVVRRGQDFRSPPVGTDAAALVRGEAIVDSNGFFHARAGAPRWDPAFRALCDYEYLLRCAGLWGLDSFGLVGEPLVEYVQTSEGVIGQSTHRDWAMELRRIWERRAEYPVLAELQAEEQLRVRTDELAARADARLPAFER
jgi:glycosyltransferase involved in cell wall biosynthesis